jgi:hypothetical protein
MPSDRSRSTDRTQHRYTGIAAQQGRVILDRDVNALQGFIADRVESEAVDVIGPCGTPDDGFAISTISGSPSNRDFRIAPGTMYVGGERIVFPGKRDGTALTYSYFNQPDWVAPSPPAQPEPPFELVYLDVIEQEVSAVEDPDLLEVALGGPDTTQRVKLLARVKRMKADSLNCTAVWESAKTGWLSQGLAFDKDTMRLAPQARLKVGFTESTSSSDPCDPVASGGYLGSDNQLIRVRTVADGTGTKLIWGYDDASFTYRATPVANNLKELTLSNDPPDGFHVPQTGQLVEILPTAAVLGVEPDETDPTGKSTIVRVAAEPDGVLFTLDQPYGTTTPGDPTKYIIVSPPMTADLADSKFPLFLRVWQAELAAPITLGKPITLADPSTNISSGVTVTISGPHDVPIADGAFWQIAVRPLTPQGAYPEDLLTSPQPPDGPRRWVCPLAVIDWQTEKVTDCRDSFENLVTLSRRKAGCCTVSIDASDVSVKKPLQALIDLAAQQARQVTVCLSSGEYALPRPLRLNSTHARMTIEACGGEVVLLADQTADPAVFADGLVVITSVGQVTLRGLTLLPPLAPVPSDVLDAMLKARGDVIAGSGSSSLGSPQASFAVHAVNAGELVLEDCQIVLPRAGKLSDVLAAAVFLQGSCPNLDVRSCAIESQIAPTFSPGETLTGNLAVAGADMVSRSVDALKLAEMPAPPSSSPPVASATLHSAQIDAAVDMLIAKAIPGASAEVGGFIATAGILSAAYGVSSSDGQPTLAAVLDGSVVHETTFTGLTFAAWISAAAGSLRLQNNVATGCVAGFWLSVQDEMFPQDAPDGTTRFSPSNLAFGEELFLRALAEAYTPSADLRPLEAVDVSQQTTQSVPSLFVSGNQIVTQPAPAITGESKGCAAAMLLSLCSAKGDEDVPALSTLVSSNSLISAGGQKTPAALVWLARYQPCAITGNIVLNLIDGHESAEAPSLWVTVALSMEGTGPISIAGNVLQGQSDLKYLSRLGLRGGWDSFNADPS